MISALIYLLGGVLVFGGVTMLTSGEGRTMISGVVLVTGGLVLLNNPLTHAVLWVKAVIAYVYNRNRPPVIPERYIEWAIKYGKPTCPTCQAAHIVVGPRGGMSVNFACVGCHARFNMALFKDGIVFFERTGTVDTQTLRSLFGNRTITKLYKEEGL